MFFKKEAVFRGHRDTVTCLSFSPDSCLLASCSLDRTIQLWDVISPRHLHSYSSPESPTPQGYGCLSWSPASRYIAAGSDGRFTDIFDVSSGSLVRSLPSQHSPVLALSWSPLGSTLVSAAADGLAHVWDVRSLSLVRSFGGHAAPVLALAHSWDGALLATAAADGLARVWDVRRGALLKTLVCGPADAAGVASRPVGSVVFAPGGRHVLVGLREGEGGGLLWDVGSGENVGRYGVDVKNRDSGVGGTAGVGFGGCNWDKVIVGGKDGVVRAFNVNDDDDDCESEVGVGIGLERAVSVVCSGDGKRVAVGGISKRDEEGCPVTLWKIG